MQALYHDTCLVLLIRLNDVLSKHVQKLGMYATDRHTSYSIIA